MERLNLYDSETFTAVIHRLDSLTGDSTAKWGTMTVAQMCSHCAEVQEVSNGKPLEGTPWLVKLMAPMIRKVVLGPKPFARDGRTHPQYIISGPEEFDPQYARLRAALQQMADDGRAKATDSAHPLFGRMTADEKGWAMYKHIDHHLAQFGV